MIEKFYDLILPPAKAVYDMYGNFDYDTSAERAAQIEELCEQFWLAADNSEWGGIAKICDDVADCFWSMGQTLTKLFFTAPPPPQTEKSIWSILLMIAAGIGFFILMLVLKAIITGGPQEDDIVYSELGGRGF